MIQYAPWIILGLVLLVCFVSVGMVLYVSHRFKQMTPEEQARWKSFDFPWGAI